MSKAKTTAAAKEDAAEAPKVLELILETRKIKVWDPIITIDGRQIVNATIDQLKQLKKDLKEQYEKVSGEDTFCEILEVQKTLRALPMKRNDKGKLVLHPQAGVPQEEQVPLEEQRPRNRMLWAIEDALKGKDPMDVNKIAVKFHSTADIKRPKYADALLLAKMVGWDTEKNLGIGIHFVDYAMKFNHIRNEDGDLVEDDEARSTLKTQARALISQSA